MKLLPLNICLGHTALFIESIVFWMSLHHFHERNRNGSVCSGVSLYLFILQFSKYPVSRIRDRVFGVLAAELRDELTDLIHHAKPEQIASIAEVRKAMGVEMPQSPSVPVSS